MSQEYVGYYETSVGIIRILCDENYVLEVGFSSEKEKNTDGSIVLDNALKQIDEYFKGKRKLFDLPLYFNGTDFQKSVWKALTEIPYGEVVSYQDIAKKINKEKAVRAVRNANNRNKIMIMIPCHRVIGKNGKLVGFAGLLDKKEFLLAHEKETNNKG